MYILDTNIMTFVLKYPNRYPHLKERISRERYEDIWVSVITVDEVIRGAYKLRDNPPRERRGNPQTNVASCYRLLSKTVMEFGQYQILTYDEEDMMIFAAFTPEVQRAAGKEDRQIAATAIRHGFTVITQNRDDFEAIPNCRHDDWTRIE